MLPLQTLGVLLLETANFSPYMDATNQTYYQPLNSNIYGKKMGMPRMWVCV
jgi:hypothetical protein